MLKTIIFYTVVIGAPLIVIVYFFLKVSTVVFVDNAGAAETALSLLIDSSTGYERTDEKRAKPGNIVLLEFTPQSEGALSITCKANGQHQNLPLGQAKSNTFFFAWVKMESCSRVVSKKVYSF